MAFGSPFNFKKYVTNKSIVLLDQAMLSVINFGSILFLSKIASVDVFSDFVITYSYSYFIFIFSTYFLSQPILVFLSKKWTSMEESYVMICSVLNMIINFFLASILFFFLSSQVDDISFLLFILLSFNMSFFDILKKFIFSSVNINVVYGLYSTVLLNLLFFGSLLFFREELTLNLILTSYGISFGFSNLLLILFLLQHRIISLKLFNSVKKRIVLEVLKTHYHYSKWIIYGGIAFWGYSQGIYIVAKLYEVDDLTIGKIRTIQNLLGVFNILLIALENHYTPLFSRQISIKRFKDLEVLAVDILKKNYIKFSLLFLLSLPIGLTFYNFLYLDKFGNGVVVFLLFLFVQMILLLIRPFGILLKAMEKTLPFFVSHILAFVLMLLSVPLFLFLNEEYGIAMSITLANAIYAGYIGVYFIRERKLTMKT